VFPLLLSRLAGVNVIRRGYGIISFQEPGPFDKGSSGIDGNHHVQIESWPVSIEHQVGILLGMDSGLVSRPLINGGIFG
jgi:hypothetical protein